MLEDIVWLRGAAQFGEGDDLFSVIKSATEEMDRIDELAGDLWALMQEWIEVDRIEGAFSCDEVLHKFDSSSLLNGENNDQRPDGFITVPRAKSVHNMSESGI